MVEGNGVGELEESGAGETLEDRRDDEPRGDDEPKREELTGLVETFGLGGGGQERRVEKPAEHSGDTLEIRSFSKLAIRLTAPLGKNLFNTGKDSAFVG